MNRFIQIYRATLVIIILYYIKIILCIEITSHVCISLLKTVQWFRLTKPNLRWSGRGIRVVWTWGGGGGGGSGGGGGGGVGCEGGGSLITAASAGRSPCRCWTSAFMDHEPGAKLMIYGSGVCVCVWVGKNEQNLCVSLTAGRCISLCRQKESKKEKQVAAFHLLELQEFLWKNRK